MCAWLLVLLVPAPAPADPADAELARLKAAIVYKLARFVTWPQDRLADAQVLQICVQDAPLIADSMSGAAVHNIGRHQSGLRVLRTPQEELAGCHVLFLGQAFPGPIEPVLEAATRYSVLTVGDRPGFAASGGSIGLVRRGTRIGFEINPDNARAGGLRISAQLLELATIVRNPD